MNVCEACQEPIEMDAGTGMWQHVHETASDECGPVEQLAATGREGIYPVEVTA